MKTIQLNRDFAFNFYPDSTLLPDIRHITEGFYGVDEEVRISYEQAKEMIAALQNFVQAVDEKKNFLQAERFGGFLDV